MEKGYQRQIDTMQEQRKTLVDEIGKMNGRIDTCRATMNAAEKAFEDAKKVVEDRKQDHAEKQEKLAALDSQIEGVQRNLDQYVKTKSDALALYNADPSNADHTTRLIEILTAEYQHALAKLENCKKYAADGVYGTKAAYLETLERRSTAVAESSSTLMKVYQKTAIDIIPSPMHVEQQFAFHGIDCTENDLTALLGALTSSVRDDWSDPNERLELIAEICSMLCEEEWGHVVTEFWRINDGRVFRDTGSGIPYGDALEKENSLYDEFHRVVCYECRSGCGECRSE